MSELQRRLARPVADDPVRAPDPRLVRVLNVALPASRPPEQEDLTDAARGCASWFADMLEEFAGTYDGGDVAERAYAIGFRGAAHEVRKTGGVR